MKATFLMAMAAATGLALSSGCNNEGGSNDGGEAANGNGAMTAPAGNSSTTAVAGSPQEVLNDFIQSIQAADFDTAIELCDESLGKQELAKMKNTWDKAQQNVADGVPNAEMAANMVRSILLSPWDDAAGEVTQQEGDVAQATITRGGDAEPVTFTMNRIDGKWLIVAPAELFGGGTMPAPGSPPN